LARHVGSELRHIHLEQEAEIKRVNRTAVVGRAAARDAEALASAEQFAHHVADELGTVSRTAKDAKSATARQAVQLRRINRTAFDGDATSVHANAIALALHRAIREQAVEIQLINRTAVDGNATAVLAKAMAAAVRRAIHDQALEIQRVNRSVVGRNGTAAATAAMAMAMNRVVEEQASQIKHVN